MARRQRRTEAGPEVGNLEHDNSTNSVSSAAVAGQQLKAFFERIERLAEEKKAITDDIREVFAEAKGNGFSPKVMRIILRRRAMDKVERDEQDALVHVYAKAVGDDSPAGADDEEVVAEFRGTIRKDAYGNVIDEGMTRTR